MKDRKISGYWLMVLGGTLAFTAIATFFGEAIDPSRAHRIGSVVMVGMVLLSVRAPMKMAWRLAARYSPNRDTARYRRDPAARAGIAEVPVEDIVAQRYVNLSSSLQHRHGWRYAQPWLLLSGEASLVDALVPGLSATGWRVFPDAVLLYADISKKLDGDWLMRIRRARRRRPVDATIQLVRASDDTQPFLGDHVLTQQLLQIGNTLGWAAPAYVLNAVDVDGVNPDPCEPVACMWSNPPVDIVQIGLSLKMLSRRLADQGVQRLTVSRRERCIAQLSRHVAKHADALSALVAHMNRTRAMQPTVAGIVFAPLSSEQAHPTWRAIATHSRHIRGRRFGFSLSRTAAWSVTACVMALIAGTFVSGTANRTTIQTASDIASKLSTPQDRTQATLTLDALQKHLDTLETRQRNGSPWYMRFGLNRDTETLNALWPTYAIASNRTLIQPIRASLEADLRQLGALTDQQLASGGEAQIKRAYDKLKAYLMLAQPQHSDARFLIPELLQTSEPARPESSQVSAGAWRDLTQRLVTFHANHLVQHGSSLAIPVDATLVSMARQTLVSVIGLRNSTDTVYEQILEENRSKYPPISLQALLGDDITSRGLFTTKETVPGIYTRAAWDERIGRAIEKADEQRTVSVDWVLTATPSTPSSGALKQALRERYFADYARNWQQFLNSVRWQQDATLSGTVDQLSLYADAQRSPLSALFKVIAYQAATGASGESLSDTLVTKARELIKGGAKDDPSRATPPPDAPLAAAFAPLLRLAGNDKTSTPQSDLSLPRYLERVTAVRLKLQHIMSSPDPDVLSRAAAQAVLQGKTSDLGDSRDYAGRVAASLSEQWAGLGEALFQRPLDQTWDVVLKPASSSLNDAWRASVVAAWNQSFAGRYPFADSDNDASLPEMARFLRADSGVIAQFVTTQLGGILERQGDQWVVAQGAGRNSLAVDPEFVRALNRLARVSNVLFPNGDAGVRYELRAIPTPGVIDMKFKLSGRELHYFNQKEEWTPFIWPGEALENSAHVEWQTQQTGVRSDLDFAGRFGLIRLLERATVTQQDGARYVLKWMPGGQASVPVARKEEAVRPRLEASAPAPAKSAHIRDDWSADPSATLVSTPLALAAVETKSAFIPRAPVQPIALQVQLRSESGAGPLDALKLRHFTLPSRIFLTSEAGKSSSNPPPLPAAAIEAAKHAATPLPRNAMPEIE